MGSVVSRGLVGRKGWERTVFSGGGNSTGKGPVAWGWVESQVGSDGESGEMIGWKLGGGLGRIKGYLFGLQPMPPMGR